MPHKCGPARRKGCLLVPEKISPGKDALLPEILLGFWADAGNMNEGALQQRLLLLLAYHAKAADVMVRVAMSGIDVCNFQRH